MSVLIPAWVGGTLQPVEKMKVHRLGLRHKAVSVFVLRGEDVLLQRRAAEKYHTPGLWANTCCTHPTWGEDPADCAIRRLDEEMGITGLDPVHRTRIEYRADVGGGLVEHELVDVFCAEATPELAVRANPSEVSGTRWVNLSGLRHETARCPEVFTPWLRLYMRDHASSIFGQDRGPAEPLFTVRCGVSGQ